MKQRIAVSLFSALVAVLFSVGQASAADQIPGEYLVKYKDNAFVAGTSLRSVGMVRIQDHNAKARLFKVKVAAQYEAQALADILSDSNVEYVVPNVRLYAVRQPIEQIRTGQIGMMALRDQYAIKKVRAEEAWQRAGNRGSRSVVVGVIDTGVDYNHESLKPNMVPGFDFKENDADPMDKVGSANPGHGTHCAGIIGSSGLVEGGTIGISPEVSIMPLRFLGEDGSGDLNAGIKAIDYAIEKKVDIISASWGATIGRQQAMPLVDAVKRADDAGVIFVVAAANDGRNNDSTEVYPANAGFQNTIAVAASGPNDEKPSWSNYGKRTVHVAAPGLDIMSTLPSNKYQNLSGTSMATPLVSGLVAFLKAQDKSLTGAQTRALLQHTGAKVQIETACNCRVDALSAVDMLLQKKMFITPAAGSIYPGDTMKFEGTFGTAPFTFAVTNASVGSIAADGTFTASAVGTTTVTVTDSKGQTSTSLDINVLDKAATPPPGGGTCPLGDQQMCDILCQIQPQLPFCNQ